MYLLKLCLLAGLLLVASDAMADEWTMPGELNPLYDGAHSWRYVDNASSPNVSIVRTDTQETIATADLTGCRFCRGVEDNCQATGIFPLPAPSVLNGVSLGVVCSWGAHSQKFLQLSELRNAELVGHYWISVIPTDVGVTVSGDGLASTEETLRFPAGTKHSSVGDGHRPRSVTPSDAHSAELDDLIRELDTVIRNRDSQALQAMLHPQVTFSFAEAPGISGFSDFWKLHDDPQSSTIWAVLEAVLAHPAAYSANSNEVVFPYYSVDWPETLSPWEYLVVVRKEAVLVAGPSATAPVVRELPIGMLVSHQPMPITRASSDWHYVQTPDGAFGYLPRNAARSPLGLRLGLTKKRGAWKIHYLVAGD